jgi:drug/metabolite transporter (DMT)-like permease
MALWLPETVPTPPAMRYTDKHQPMPMPLLALLAVATVLYSALLILSSRASGRIDPYWSSMVFGVASIVTPLALWLLGRMQHKPVLPTTASGLAYSIVAGAVAGIFTALLVKIFEKGAVSFAPPVIYGGAMVLTAVVGWLFFKEAVTALQATGIIVTAIGVALIVYAKLHGANAA